MDERAPSSAGWYPDPTRRYEYRYHNGRAWTGDVATGGQRFVDAGPIVPPPPIGPGGAAGRPGGRTRNGLATAALTCGIVSVAIGWLPVVFVAGAALAVLAIVFGAIGLRRSRVIGSGRGFAITGLVTGGAGLAVAAAGLLLTIVTFRAIERYEDPADHSVAIEQCTVAGGTAQVVGSLRNESDGVAEFTVLVELVTAARGTRVATFRAEIDDLGPGKSTTFEFTRQVDVEAVECQIVEVTGPLPFGIVPA